MAGKTWGARFGVAVMVVAIGLLALSPGAVKASFTSFSLSFSPTSTTVTAGGSASYTVNLGLSGSWPSTTPLPVGLVSGSAVAYNGYVYFVGGLDGSSDPTNSVFYAPVNSNGTLGAWSSTTVLPVLAYEQSMVAYNGYMYLIGGNLNYQISSAVYDAPINADGTLGSWTATASLPVALQLGSAVANNGYVYMIGGQGTPPAGFNTYISQIQPDGTLGSWATSTSLLADPTFMGSAATYGNHVYTVGRYFAPDVNAAQFNSDGTIGSWVGQTPLPQAVYDESSVAYNGYLYSIGGEVSGGPTSTVYAASVQSGNVGSWSQQVGTPVGVAQQSAVAYNGYVYSIGGQTSNGITPNVYYDQINSDGTLAGTWELPLSLFASQLPTSSVASFSASPVKVPGSSRLTITTNSATPPGTYRVGVTATVNGTNPNGIQGIEGTVNLVVLPVPVIASLNPTSTFTGGPDLALAVNGTNFIQSSTVDWNGSPLASTFVSSTQLTAIIPAADTAATSTDLVTVVNPGGVASNALAFAVSQAATSVALTSTATSSVYGTSVTFAATVTPTTGISPTGMVIFMDGATTLGTVALNGANPGVATFATTTLSVAGSPHSIVAIYGGDNNFTGSTSSAVSQIVTPQGLTVTGITANNKTYDGTTTATLNTASAALVGVISGDAVTLNTAGATGTFATSSVGTGILVTVSGITISGPSASNYVLTQPTTTANITNPVPATTSISPASTTVGSAGFTLTINGTNFIQGSAVDWNGVALATTTYVSATQLNAAIPASLVASAGTSSVTVVNLGPGGGTSNAQTFTIKNLAPITTSISPTSTTAGSASFTLTVNGANFLHSSVIDWNGTALTTTYVSGTKLTAPISAANVATVGTDSVTIVNPGPGGGTSNAQTFTVKGVPNFTIAATPASQSVKRLNSVQYTITIASQYGFAGKVSFKVTGLPNDASASFSPTTITGSGSTKMTVKAGLTTGTFNLIITGTSGSLTQTASVSVTVTK